MHSLDSKTIPRKKKMEHLLLSVLTTTVFWLKVICDLVQASQIIQMPTWTGCLTSSKIMNKCSLTMLNVRPLAVRINMVCANRNLVCAANYWPRASKFRRHLEPVLVNFPIQPM